MTTPAHDAVPTDDPATGRAVDRSPQTFFVRTFGCQMNEHDSERIAGLLESEGLVAVDSAEAADVVVLNTCTIRENADTKLYGTLGHLKSMKDRKPGMQIAVGGCMAQKDQAAIQQRAPYVDAVFGTHNVGSAWTLLQRARLEGPVMEILQESEEFPSALPVRRDDPWSAWVTIQIGCNNTCAYCIVPAVRGVELSRPITEIVDEVTRLVADGTTEVTLLGQNVNSYGRDLTGRSPLFSQLLREVAAVDGLRRVRYTSPHPKDMRGDVFAAMASSPKICNHLHYPLQSGSDRVLAAMHRGYTAERYLRQLREARATLDDLAVTTDLIVGFPGETDDDFERTLEVAAEARWDSAYTFIFSPRPGTEAAAFTDRFVAPEVVAERFERLKIVVEHSARERHAARVGRLEELLVQGPSRKDPAVLTGRTTQNKLCHFAAPADSATGQARPVPAGSYATARVTSAAAHFLRGDLVEVTARPSHKTRLPLAVLD